MIWFLRMGFHVFIIVLFFFCGLLFVANPAFAAYRDVSVTVSSKVVYNDNIFWDEDDRQDDFVATVSPAINADYRTERTSVRAAARLSWIRYHQLQELDDHDVSLSLSAQQSINPRMSVNVSAGWKQDTQSDRDFADTGLIYNTEKRQTWSLQAGLTRSHSEIASSQLSFSLQGEDNQSGDTDEVSSYGTSYGFFWGLSERTTLRTFLKYSLQDYDEARIDKYSATFGAEWKIDERWDVQCDVGGRWMKTERDQKIYWTDGYHLYWYIDHVENSEWGGVAKFAMTRKFESGQVSASFSHDLESASGSDSSTERTGISLTANRRFSRSWAGSVSTSYYINKSVGDSQGTSKTDETSLSFRPSVRYQVNPELAFDLGYQFSLNDDDVDGSRVHRNLWFLQLTWSDSVMDL